MPNIGHGHVIPREDGLLSRCGGPALCSDCARELEIFEEGVRWAVRKIRSYSHYTDRGRETERRAFLTAAEQLERHSLPNLREELLGETS